MINLRVVSGWWFVQEVQLPTTNHQPNPVTYRVGGVAAAAVPIDSPETISSTRRFCWLPAGVSFDATGCFSPAPTVMIRSARTLRVR